MDRRPFSNTEVGFDACDPLGSVLEWSRQTRAARVLQRRCRSEGVESSPYDDAHFELRSTLFRTPKSHFTLNSRVSRFDSECRTPVEVNGDYLMGNNDPQRKPQLSPTKSKGKSKTPSPTGSPPPRRSPTKTEKRRLPRVEELLHKVEQSILEASPNKEPLKSILNNQPPVKSPPPSILKKPKTKSAEAKAPEGKASEGRRRQRAASESDHVYYNYRVATTPPVFDGRLTYLSTNTKRLKDNNGYTSLSSPKGATRKPYNETNQANEVYYLRTSVINNVVPEDTIMEFPRFDIDVPQCPCPLPPAEPVPTPLEPESPPSKKGAKKKPRAKIAKKLANSTVDDNSSSRSPSLSPVRKTPPTQPPPTQSPPTQSKEEVKVAPSQLCRDKIEQIEQIEKIKQEKLAKIKAAINGTEINLKKVDDLHTRMVKLSNGNVLPVKKPEERSETKRDAFIASLHTTNPFRLLPRKESPLNIPENLVNCFRQSLFPRVPPYLKFVGHDDPVVKMPISIQKHLKWKTTTITPIVVKKTLINSGFRLVKSECETSECPEEETVEWIGIWGKHMKSIMFRAIKDGQKMNHFPGTFQVGRKDRLWRNLQKLSNKFGLDEFGIMPKTYVMPHDMKLLKHDWDKLSADEERWIIKPPASARGTGIKVVSRWTQIPKKRSVVVQKYISKPYLINGNKFDMRLYVLVTSVHPLRIYMYKDGLARFASVKYNDELGSLSDRYMHLTNYSINRLSKNYTPNEDFAACEGHKWTLQSLFQYLKTEKGIDTDALWLSLKDLVIKTIISGEASISSLTKANITSRYNCYELFGIDVLLDQDLKPWLLEVNISPSLHSASPLDIHVKGPLVTTVLNVAQFQLPARAKENREKITGLPYDSRLYTIYLSKEERDKHIIYTNMEDRDTYLRDILSTLTPDDVRHLLQAEDELTQASRMERIFPTNSTHRYLNFLNGARYYNRLFDAWETRYHNDRGPGIDLLRNLCDIGYHLEVPPVPLKNDVDAPSPPPSDPPSIISLEVVTSTSGTFSPPAQPKLPPPVVLEA